MTEVRCPTDDTLLPAASGETVAEELRDHLQHCSDCQNRVDRLRTELDDLRSSPPSPCGAAPPRPAVIGKYLVVGELDSGGQSVVYRALHPTLDKELVIKLSREAFDPENDDRDLLVREGKLLASLEHPNLAHIYDLDFHGDLPFLVMEYVRGRTLAEHAATVRVEPREAAGIIAAIARALAVVHRRGIIHQDIKPRNIMIDAEGRPRLIDFGLARIRHAWEHADEPFGGTPAFTSPEQARGDAAQVTARSDLFSLGGVLYFLLSGKAPFEAPSGRESLAKAERCDFNRVALKSVKPRRLAAIALRAMAASPDQRYDRAEALATDLEHIAAPVRSRRNLLIGAFGLATAVFGVWLGGKLFERPVVSDLHVDVIRGEARLNLDAALPLNPQIDQLRFTARIPAGYAAAMFSYDLGDEVKALEFSSETAGGVQTLHFPKAGSVIGLQPGPTRRSQIVIVVAAPTVKELEGFNLHLSHVLRDELGDLEPLPQRWAVRLDRHGVHGQGFGETKPDPDAPIQGGLDRLRRRLHEHAEIVLGVAFSY